MLTLWPMAPLANVVVPIVIRRSTRRTVGKNVSITLPMLKVTNVRVHTNPLFIFSRKKYSKKPVV